MDSPGVEVGQTQLPTVELTRLNRQQFVRQYAGYIASVDMMVMKRDPENSENLLVTEVESDTRHDEVDGVLRHGFSENDSKRYIEKLSKRDARRTKLQSGNKLQRAFAFLWVKNTGTAKHLPTVIEFVPLEGDPQVIRRIDDLVDDYAK